MNRPIVNALEGVRGKLAKGWCQRAMAKDSLGGHMDPQSPYAVRWCLVGAVLGSTDLSVNTRVRVLDAIQDVTGCRFPSTWNDTPGRTQEEVLAVLDTAIDKEKDYE